MKPLSLFLEVFIRVWICIGVAFSLDNLFHLLGKTQIYIGIIIIGISLLLWVIKPILDEILENKI